MRLAVIVTLVTVAVGCGAGAGAPNSTAAPTAGTQLTITYWPEGKSEGGRRQWTLRCSPAGGTLPRPGAACRKLGAMTSPFAPIPPGAMCTQQYGGPQVAVIKGTLRGRTVWAQLQNRDGCEIARFEKLSFLVPGFGSGSSA